MKIWCVFSLDSPHRGNSNECKPHTSFNMKNKTTQFIPNIIMSATMEFCSNGNSRGKRAGSARATEVLLNCKLLVSHENIFGAVYGFSTKFSRLPISRLNVETEYEKSSYDSHFLVL